MWVLATIRKPHLQELFISPAQWTGQLPKESQHAIETHHLLGVILWNQHLKRNQTAHPFFFIFYCYKYNVYGFVQDCHNSSAWSYYHCGLARSHQHVSKCNLKQHFAFIGKHSDCWWPRGTVMASLRHILLQQHLCIGLCFNMETILPATGISVMKLRWSWDRLNYLNDKNSYKGKMVSLY